MQPDLSFRGILLLSALALVTPAALTSQVNTKTDGAFTSLQVEGDSRFGNDNPRQLTFVWYPAISPEGATYRLDAECSHRNRLGAPPETGLRVVFTGSMVPVSAGAPYELTRKRAKLRGDGSQNRRIRWQDPIFADLASQGFGDGVMIQLEIVLKGPLSFGDVITCEAGMSESRSRPIL